MKIVYLDTGPLVALFRKRDQFHQWVKTVLSQDDFRFITCEAVLTETLLITQNSPLIVESLTSMIDNNLLELKSALILYKDEVFHLLQKYHDQKTALADICLLTLYNNEEGTSIFTTDSDFLVYRDSKGKPLHLISPYSS